MPNPTTTPLVRPARIWPAWLVFVTGLLLSALGSLQVRYAIESDAMQEFALACDRVSVKVEERLEAYALILRGAAALFAASVSVERQEWGAYVEKLRAGRTVAGVQGIGFAQLVSANELASHTEQIRREGFADYSIRPVGQRPLYSSIIYLEPFTGRNLRAFGYDMYSEPVRRAAMEQARDSGNAALSGKVELVQETGTEVQAGTLMYVPVFRNGMPFVTVAQRRAALQGWVYSPYRMDDLMQGILGDWMRQENHSVRLSLYDGAVADPARLLFDSSPESRVHAPSLLLQRRTIDFNGRTWLLQFDRTALPRNIGYGPAWASLAGGLILSALMFGLLLSFANTRTNAARIAVRLTEETRNREQLLQESEALKLAILNSLSSEIAVIDQNGVIQAVNEPWRRFALDNSAQPGVVPPGTEVGANYLAVCMPTPDASTDMRDSRQGISAVLEGLQPSFSMEYACNSPTRQRWFSMTVSPLGPGTQRGVVISHTDITERKLAEQALQFEHQRLRHIIEGTRAGTWEWNVQTGNCAINERWAEMLGYTLPELEPVHIDTWKRLIHPDDVNVALDLANRHFAGELDYYESETRLRHKNGEWIWVLDRGRVVEWSADGKPLLMSGTHLEISKRKRAETLLAAKHQLLLRSNAELEQFAYVASHDLRQPLRMINSYVQMLERRLADKLDDGTRQMMGFVAEGAQRMDQMLVSLLEFSRVGRKGEPMTALESRDAVEEALRFLEPAIREAQAEVHLDGDWPTLLASRNELTRLFQNLIGNAIKYRASERPPRVELTVAAQTDGWQFCVTDNGIGIDPAQFERLFKVFQRLHTRTKFEGSGIGLAVCRKIVERHGGRIWVESAGEGHGCSFCFTLPTLSAASDAEVTP